MRLTFGYRYRGFRDERLGTVIPQSAGMEVLYSAFNLLSVQTITSQEQ